MNWQEAQDAMTRGEKVTLPEWVGYWYKQDGKILVFTGKCEILDTPFIDSYKDRTDWKTTDGSRCYGGALLALKAGKLVQRKGWNGKDMFIFMRPGDEIPAQIVIENVKSLPQSFKNYLNNQYQGDYAKASGNGDFTIEFLPYLCMKAANGEIVNGWLASQTDMLAEDWYVLEY